MYIEDLTYKDPQVATSLVAARVNKLITGTVPIASINRGDSFTLSLKFYPEGSENVDHTITVLLYYFFWDNAFRLDFWEGDTRYVAVIDADQMIYYEWSAVVQSHLTFIFRTPSMYAWAMRFLQEHIRL